MCVELAVLRTLANHWGVRNKGLELQRELDYSFLGQGLNYFWFILCS